MRSLNILIGGLAATVLFTGCAVTTASFPHSTPAQGETVRAHISHFSVLFLNPLRDTERLMIRLAENCAKGRVEGITVTRIDRYWWVAGVQSDLEAVGLCRP